MRLLVCALGWLASAGPANSAAEAPAAGSPTDELIPLIKFEDAPLTDSIQVIARSMHLNVIQDPDILARNGRQSEPLVSIHWKNIHLSTALQRLLDQHSLVMTTNPVTTVARITRKDRPVAPVDAAQVGPDPGERLPMLLIEDAPLGDSILTLGKQAGLPITFAPDTADVLARRDLFSSTAVTVSIRWENLSARQALAALLDNHDLVLIETAKPPTARIERRSGAEIAAAAGGTRFQWGVAVVSMGVVLALSACFGWWAWRRV